jgi:alpha-L-fucosidase
MERRDFCRMIAAAAAAATVPITAEAGQEKEKAPDVSPEEAAKVAETPAFKSFDTLTEDYATFCATPASQREFFELKDGQFVKKKLDEAAWRPSEWGDLRNCRFPAGLWTACR